MTRPGAQPASHVARRSDEELRELPAPRPLLWPAIAFIAGLWLSESLGALAGGLWWAVLLLPPLTLALALVVNRTHRHTLATALLLAAAAGVGLLRHQTAIRHPANHVAHLLDRERVLTRLAGEIISTPARYPPQKRNPFLPFDPPAQTRFVLAVRQLRTTDPPTPIRGRLRVTIDADGLGLRLGDRVELTGWLYAPRPPRNPGEFDWARWHHLQGLDAGLSVDGAPHVRRLAAGGPSWRRMVAALRSAAQSLLLEPYADLGPAADDAQADEPDQAARLLQTMVLGQRGAADRRLNEAFLRAGGLHFLAVSGFHVGALCAVAWLVARWVFRRSALAAALAVLVVILLYALVAEPNAPILRAAILAGLATIALLTRRALNLTNWLAAAALCILMYNPLELFRPGFQLSFVQVLALLIVVPRAYRAVSRRRPDDPPTDAATVGQLLLRRTGLFVSALVLISAVAWLTSLPLVWLHFGRFAPWGAVGTLLLSIPVTATIWLSFLTLLGNLALPPVGRVLGTALSWATDLVLKLVGLFEHVPLAVVELAPPPGWLVLATYLALLLMLTPADAADRIARGSFARLIRTRWTRGGLIAAVAIVWLSWWVWPRSSDEDCRLYVLSVGNGSANLLVSPGGHAAVFDAGTDRNLDAGELVVRTCRALGVRQLDELAISHANFDHYSGVPTLLGQMSVRRLWLNPYFGAQRDGSPAVRTFFGMLLPDAPTPEILAAGDRLRLGKAGVEVLWPPADLNPIAWDANDRSLVLRVHVFGRVILLTGDIEDAAMQALLAAEAAGRIRLTADILLAPHHGSVSARSTASFYASVNPQVVVVSAADERPRLVELIWQTLGARCAVVSTARPGAVCIHILPGGELRVETPLAVR